MAGYTNHREEQYEIKYLRNVMGKVDARILAPESLSGDVLRAKLENIYPTVAPKPSKKSGFPFGTGWFSLQSGLSYVVAFALIIGLFYGLGFNNAENTMPVSPYSLVEEQRAASTLAEGAEDQTTDIPPAPQIQGFSARSGMGMEPATGGAEAQPEADIASSTAISVSELPEPAAVGGGGKTVALGELNGLTYAYRINDRTDPDKASYPVTLEVTDSWSSEMMIQLNLADMVSVSGFYRVEDNLALVGEGEGDLVMRLFSVAEPANPQELLTVRQPGLLLASREYRGFVHLVSFAEGAEQQPFEVVELPYSRNKQVCVVTAMDMINAQAAQKGFLGASDQVSLYNLNSYVYYPGELPPDEEQNLEAETEFYYAQIRFDGLSIELGSVS